MRIAAFVTAVSVTLLGAVAVAQNVGYDFDRTADFSRFNTYTWVDGHRLADALNHQRIVRAIDAQLMSKGLRSVQRSANPDVLVSYHASFDKNLQIDALGSGFGRFGGMRNATATTQEVVTGTIVVDVMDARTNAIVWRGMASKEINLSASPDKREKEINKAAQKIFKNYPTQR